MRSFSLHRRKARAILAFQGGCVVVIEPQPPNPKPQGGPKYPSRPPKWHQDGPDMAQDGPQIDPCSPKVFPMYPQDGINLAQDVHPTTYNIQHTSHIAGPAECAVAIE